MRASSLNRELTHIRKIWIFITMQSNVLRKYYLLQELLDDPELGSTAKDEIEHLEEQGKVEPLIVASDASEEEIQERIQLSKLCRLLEKYEASLFAADLFRMYCKYGENKSWGFECLSQSSSETGGV